MVGKLLLVIPPVVRLVDGVHEVEFDFANNLRVYLENFDRVTFACPVSPFERDRGILRSLRIRDLPNSDRLSFVPLPYAYREDRYLRHYLATRTLLRSEIREADYLIFSPHAKYDWATLAAVLAMKLKRKYDLESDWVHESVQRLNLAEMPPGLTKIRKTLWMYSFLKAVKKCMSNSSLALLQGQEVFEAYKDIAPNPQKVLNVQVTPEDRIPIEQLQEKLARIYQREPLTISYAGRMAAMKGPLDWINAVHCALQQGVELRATWFGDGPLMKHMQSQIARLGLSDNIFLRGVVSRTEIMANLRTSDIFLFCHKTGESPRCLGEALAAGCPLVGYDSAYPRDLVARHGGGEFCTLGDWGSLADLIVGFAHDRAKLAHLVQAAASSGELLDRDTAIQKRIALIKRYLS